MYFAPELVRMSEKRDDRRGREGGAGERGGAAAIKLHYWDRTCWDPEVGCVFGRNHRSKLLNFVFYLTFYRDGLLVLSLNDDRQVQSLLLRGIVRGRLQDKISIEEDPLIELI